MRVNGRVLSIGVQRGFFNLALLAAVAAFVVLLTACGGSGSTNGGGGGGDGNDGASGDGTLTVSPSQAKPGQVLTVRGTKLPKGGTDPIVRGELVAVTPTGEVSLANINIFNQTFSQTAFVPEDLTPGEYTITLKLKGEQEGKSVSAKLTVLAP